ncbi:MAG: SDR family oxidoreductase, partial [Pseudomonadota bacterium]
MEQRFKDKVIIITGAGGEIGAATAQRFSDDGASIVAADHDGGGVAAMVDKLTRAGRPAIGETADVTQAADMSRVVDAALDAYGRVDAFINNAGVEGPVAPVEAYSEEEFDKVIAVNVRGVFLGMKYAIPALRQSGGGSIVNLASVAGLSGSAGTPAYNASKHAVIGLTRSAAVQLGPENIRVNAVCPSPVEGRMFAALEKGFAPDDPGAIRESVTQRIPLHRYAETADVASLITYLCSDEAAFLN